MGEEFQPPEDDNVVVLDKCKNRRERERDCVGMPVVGVPVVGIPVVLAVH